MAAIKTVDVGNIFEVAAPFINAEQVEIGGADEENRALVAMKKAPDVRNIVEFLGLFSLVSCDFCKDRQVVTEDSTADSRGEILKTAKTAYGHTIGAF